MSVIERIQAGRFVPVIALENAADAVPLCQALKAGGLLVAEFTFRTSAAAEAIAAVARELPEFAVGAGTVTTIAEVQAAVEAGAQFAVAPGLNPRIVNAALELDLPFFPGVCTPTDIEGALELGCEVLKFFPAGAMGGVATLKAIYPPYKHRGVRFIPTGGVTAANMAEYLATPGVLAVGGTWIVEAGLIREKNWARITQLTREALGR